MQTVIYRMDKQQDPTLGFLGGSDGKESACNVEDLGSVLEKGMATHSSILAWRIPWTEEPIRP